MEAGMEWELTVKWKGDSGDAPGALRRVRHRGRRTSGVRMGDSVMLLKVVIVEDEEIIRKGLTFALNWLDMGCIIVGTAKDGAEGLGDHTEGSSRILC